MQAGLTDIAQSSRPWQTCGIDIVVPLPETGKGNKWILSIVDHFTRWAIAVAIPDRQSSTIAQTLFDNFISVHGAPEKIVSDQEEKSSLVKACENYAPDGESKDPTREDTTRRATHPAKDSTIST